MELSYKQRMFVAFYLGESNGNATDAARRAGYAHPNMAGPRLMVKDGIRAAIDARLETAAMGANEVLARLSEIASGDIGGFLDIDENGPWRVNLHKARKAGRTRLLKKLKAVRGGGTEIELLNPLDALDKLARHHGLYKERHDLDAGAAEIVILEPKDVDTSTGGPPA